MTMSISSLTHHAESVGETLDRLRRAGVRDRRISVQALRGDDQQPRAVPAMSAVPPLHREWLAAGIALMVAVGLIHGTHAVWVGPAVVGLTAVMLGCAAWAGIEQATYERRRQRCAGMVEENGVLITVHEVEGVDAGGIERLLHDSGGEAVFHEAARPAEV